ncbi:hypothetical protein Nepgr_027355 [Nepenthes gracilis]|uniref:Aminotransferase-like plant mobile domain-containing protein n=1 Tax=Nepenthes gracilis TaxID=150966 RepID=A0AAD3Y161_NEPGR|nr:hypothetical protein Nepgr_027355 [Nepenthes gracilis]
MEEESLQLPIMVERENELMVSPTDGTPTQRTAHFLNPTISTNAAQEPLRPSISLSSPPRRLMKVTFKGWRNPNEQWTKWVQKLQPLHHLTWKNVGIYEAVMASTFEISRNDDLLLGLADYWCSNTNTFVFPWGEATITLEDMVVLAGYSVLGGSVSAPTESTLHIQEKLIEVHRSISQGKSHKTSHNMWMKHFMELDSPVEHEAFLTLWLSRFVLPSVSSDTVMKKFFMLAIYLSRGNKIALAPVVLASIYRDLTRLKSTMITAAKLGKSDDSGNFILATILWAPFQIVQVWAWERFPALRLNPGKTEPGEPRFARWHQLHQKKIVNVGTVFESAGDTFLWRPYALPDDLLLNAFYREKVEFVRVSSNSDKDVVESFARCLRVCELAGVDCIENYNPHRVAMQFGFDQDIPDHVLRSDRSTPEDAWKKFASAVKHEFLFFPSRLYEPVVTVRYLKWQKQSELAPPAAFKNVQRVERSQPGLQKRNGRDFAQNDEHHPLSGSKPEGKSSEIVMRSRNKDTVMEISSGSEGEENGVTRLRSRQVKKEDDDANEANTHLTFRKCRRSTRKDFVRRYQRRPGEVNDQIVSKSHIRCLPSSPSGNQTSLGRSEFIAEARGSKPELAFDVDDYYGSSGSGGGSGNESGGCTSETLAERVRTLERTVAQINAALSPAIKKSP